MKIIVQKMKKGIQRYIILRNENASVNYTTQFIVQIFKEEGKDSFETKINVLGHAQQGGSPSPFDRNFGTKLAARAIEWLLGKAKESVSTTDGVVFTKESTSAVVLGLIERSMVFTPVDDLRFEFFLTLKGVTV